MAKKFRRGLVVGKFAPLHAGHQHVIETALSMCERVVVISYSNPFLTSARQDDVRHWLTTLFGTDRIDYILPTTASPHNDHPDRDHRDFCLDLLLQHNITVDAVFTSEQYGVGFAHYLSIAYHDLYDNYSVPVTHVEVDAARVRYPTSGTEIRRNGILTNDMVSPVVKGSFVPRIAILGGESSGKTTLAVALCDAVKHNFTAAVAFEYGRELSEQLASKHQTMFRDDMVDIATEQIRRERDLSTSLVTLSDTTRPLLICDTTPLTTLWYSRSWYGSADAQLNWMATMRRYDLVVLCDPAIPFNQDGTRVGEDFRDQAHRWYIKQLNGRRIDHITVTGDVGERVEQVVTAINANTMGDTSWYA